MIGTTMLTLPSFLLAADLSVFSERTGPNMVPPAMDTPRVKAEEVSKQVEPADCTSIQPTLKINARKEKKVGHSGFDPSGDTEGVLDVWTIPKTPPSSVKQTQDNRQLKPDGREPVKPSAHGKPAQTQSQASITDRPLAQRQSQAPITDRPPAQKQSQAPITDQPPAQRKSQAPIADRPPAQRQSQAPITDRPRQSKQPPTSGPSAPRNEPRRSSEGPTHGQSRPAAPPRALPHPYAAAYSNQAPPGQIHPYYNRPPMPWGFNVGSWGHHSQNPSPSHFAAQHIPNPYIPALNKPPPNYESMPGSQALKSPPNSEAQHNLGSFSRAPQYPPHFGVHHNPGPYSRASKFPTNSKPQHGSEWYSQVPPYFESRENAAPSKFEAPCSTGMNSRAVKHFASRAPSTPVRFPAANKAKSSALKIPDDSEEPSLHAPLASAKHPLSDGSSNLLPNGIQESQPTPGSSTTSSGSSSFTVQAEEKKRPQERPPSRPKRLTAGKNKKWAEYDAAYTPLKRSCVDYIAEWEFPPDIASKYEYIIAQLKEGKQPLVTKGRCEGEHMFTKKRRTGRRKPQAQAEEKKEGPIVADAEFDTSYLMYDESPLGFLDQLVRPSIVEIPSVPPKDRLEKLPNQPVLSSSESRVGPRYQARIPRSVHYHDKRGKIHLPE
jgi:hypothetical protein